MSSVELTQTGREQFKAPCLEELGPDNVYAIIGPLNGRSSAATALARSDRDALYAEFSPLVRRLLRIYGTTPEHRDDLVGEIYYRFCDLYEAYDPKYQVPLRPYLVRKLSVSIYSLFRRDRRRALREAPLDEADQSHVLDGHADPTNGWIEQLYVEGTLIAAICRLPERQRKVILWRYYGDASFEQIADRMQIQQASVRSLLRYGLRALRSAISQACLE
jgi:RNA polymerase sigma factor (sigma-70 family)